MSTRISSADRSRLPVDLVATIGVALSLAACDPPVAPDRAAGPAGQARIACAHRGAPLARDCTIDRRSGSPNLTIRYPDGGFRRLIVTADGHGVVAADGAERADVAIVGDGEIEVAIGGDRFRLPATVKAARR